MLFHRDRLLAASSVEVSQSRVADRPSASAHSKKQPLPRSLHGRIVRNGKTTKLFVHVRLLEQAAMILARQDQVVDARQRPIARPPRARPRNRTMPPKTYC